MPRAVELKHQGRDNELWQMCCGYFGLSLDEFMSIQKRLLLEQLELLSSTPLGKKIMRGSKPRTVEEFRRQVPLTTYADYCPELGEKREDVLPTKPVLWMHTSGRTGEYPCKWIPLSPDFAQELSAVLYGTGIIASGREAGDSSRVPVHPRILYSVAPRPYVSGTFADVLRKQTPITYMPVLEEAEEMLFEDRIKVGFSQAMSQGIDYFFGLSLVLVTVGEKFRESSTKVDIRQYLARPRALGRLVRGALKSRLEGRKMLPKDLWSLRGIISSGLDSWVYKERIKDLWGRYPLDIYSCTEGGVIATQAWDYGAMTFIPNLNFFEFIPEEENLKWQMDRSYRPRTLLLDEVKPGENYEIVITNFHGGAMMRYRVGDMVRITSLSNDKLGIALPQMVFERRADDVIEFAFIRFTEKTIWQAIENTGVAYEDWIAHKTPGETVLRIMIEAKESFQGTEQDLAAAIEEQLRRVMERDADVTKETADDWRKSVAYQVEVLILPRGTFTRYKANKQAAGADLAHLKPPHLNPSAEMLSVLVARPGETGAGAEKAAAREQRVA